MDNQADDITKNLITFSDGSQAITQTSANVTAQVMISDLEVVDQQTIDITDEQLNGLIPKLMTHTIEADTITGNISVIPKEMPKSNTDTQTPQNQGDNVA